jgi:hypothetical protein
MVLADGFPCNGKTFPSLSKVAFAMLRANNLIDQPPSAEGTSPLSKQLRQESVSGPSMFHKSNEISS